MVSPPLPAELTQDDPDALVRDGHDVRDGVGDPERVVVDVDGVVAGRRDVVLVVLDLRDDPELLLADDVARLLVGEQDLLDLRGRAVDLLVGVPGDQHVQRLPVVRRGGLALLLRAAPPHQDLAARLLLQPLLVGALRPDDQAGVVEPGVRRDRDLALDLGVVHEHVGHARDVAAVVVGPRLALDHRRRLREARRVLARLQHRLRVDPLVGRDQLPEKLFLDVLDVVALRQRTVLPDVVALDLLQLVRVDLLQLLLLLAPVRPRPLDELQAVGQLLRPRLALVALLLFNALRALRRMLLVL